MEHYFNEIFSLLPERIRPEGRKTFKAYDGTNNIFNLAYEMLSWRVHRALIKAKLEPYLGYLHGLQHGKPSLVCDFLELYRYLVDDFIIAFAKRVEARDFLIHEEVYSSNKRGKRLYLNKELTDKFLMEMGAYLTTKVKVPRIRFGKKQEIETLINEEALRLAKYLRREINNWTPRVVTLCMF